jgi:transposase
LPPDHATPSQRVVGSGLCQLDTACGNAEDLAEAATERFAQHPDAAIITSMPGLAALTGARVLAEIGDDRARFADARGLNGLRR